MPKKKPKPKKLTPEQRQRQRKIKENRRRKKEIAKLTRKKSRERGPNPHSAVRYHHGFVYDPVRYTVLTGSQMSEDRVEMVTSALKTVTSGPQAMTLPEKPGWRCLQIGVDGRVYLIEYCGIEVALFFKRQLTEIVPGAGDKVPEGVLQDPIEAWQRLDLLGRSAEKQHFVLAQSQRRLEDSNKLLGVRVQNLDALYDDAQRTIIEKQAAMDGLEATIRELKKQIKTLRYGAVHTKVPDKLQQRAGERGKRPKRISHSRTKTQNHRPKRKK